MMNTGKLKGMTLFITGASRGIGREIALKAAKDGANIVIAAKTTSPHPKLPGTIYTTAEEVEKAGGKALACPVDIRDEAQLQKAVNDAVNRFGGIDIVVNNASAISLTPTLETDMKKYDLMNSINTRGTFLVSKLCLPYLKKGRNPHILNLSPPINLNPVWFENHLAYTISKYGMSLCVLGLHKEFKDDGIAVNALWPKTAIATAAINMLAGEQGMKQSRTPEIVADAAYAILTKDSKKVTGNFFIDEDVLRKEGIADFQRYSNNPSNRGDLTPDFFIDIIGTQNDLSSPKFESSSQSINPSDSADLYSTKIEEIFLVINKVLNEDLTKRVQAVYEFHVKGPTESIWFIDLKNGKGRTGKCKAPVDPDVILTMDAKDFFDLFSGKMKAAQAFLSGRLKISGNLQHAMKLEKLMSSLKSKM